MANPSVQSDEKYDTMSVAEFDEVRKIDFLKDEKAFSEKENKLINKYAYQYLKHVSEPLNLPADEKPSPELHKATRAYIIKQIAREVTIERVGKKYEDKVGSGRSYSMSNRDGEDPESDKDVNQIEIKGEKGSILLKSPEDSNEPTAQEKDFITIKNAIMSESQAVRNLAANVLKTHGIEPEKDTKPENDAAYQKQSGNAVGEIRLNYLLWIEAIMNDLAEPSKEPIPKKDELKKASFYIPNLPNSVMLADSSTELPQGPNAGAPRKATTRGLA